MNTKKRFYIYASWEEQFEILSTEEKSTMLMNLFKYQRGEEPILDTTGLKLVWAGMKFLLEQDDLKYQAAVSRAQKSAQAKKLPEPIKQEPVPVKWKTEPVLHNRNRPDNVNVNVNVNDNVDVNVNEKGNVNEDDDGFPIVNTPISQSSQRRSEQFDKVFFDGWDD